MAVIETTAYYNKSLKCAYFEEMFKDKAFECMRPQNPENEDAILMKRQIFGVARIKEGHL